MRSFEVDLGIRYAGFCYDGPHEGQWCESETSILMKCAQDPMWWKHAWLLDNPTPINYVHQIFYRWSDPLKKWVCLNMK